MSNEIAKVAVLTRTETTPLTPTLALNRELYLNNTCTTLYCKDTRGVVHTLTGGSVGGSVDQSDINDAVTTHINEANPHSNYQLKSEKNEKGGYVSIDNLGRVKLNSIDETNFSYIRNNNTGPTSYAYHLPTGKGGTFAMLSDIYDSAVNPIDYQLKEEKTEKGGYVGIDAAGKIIIKSIDGSNTSYLRTINSDSNNPADSSYVYTLPNKTGTVALLSDINDNAVNPTDYQLKSERTEKGGYVGIDPTGKIIIKSIDGSNTSFLRTINSNNKDPMDSSYVYTLPNKTGTLAIEGDVGGVVPIGGIIMWSGTIATIPNNWLLCDGNGGTPNLTNRFIVGASQDESGLAKTTITTDLTRIGGTKDSIIPYHRHVILPNTDNAASNGLSAKGFIVITDDEGSGPDAITGLAEGPAFSDSLSGFSHISRDGSIQTKYVGVEATNKNLPPYFALAFIMRIA